MTKPKVYVAVTEHAILESHGEIIKVTKTSNVTCGGHVYIEQIASLAPGKFRVVHHESNVVLKVSKLQDHGC